MSTMGRYGAGAIRTPASARLTAALASAARSTAPCTSRFAGAEPMSGETSGFRPPPGLAEANVRPVPEPVVGVRRCTTVGVASPTGCPPRRPHQALAPSAASETMTASHLTQPGETRRVKGNDCEGG